MYLRFIISDVDLRTGKPTGIFTISYRLLKGKELSQKDHKQLQASIKWLEKHLPIPSKFSRKKNDSHKNTHGISWLKPEAKEAIQHFWSIKAILEANDIQVEVMKTKRPGYVVYEDDYQLVAEPFHGE